jgi:prephenate dehydratase
MSIPKISFQGEPGAYSELAAFEHFGTKTRTVPCESFESAFEAVSCGTCEYGLLPFENSLAGSIHRNYDLLLRHELYIVSEYHLRVQHCLLGLPGTKIEDIREVRSHPQALAQCEHRLTKMSVKRVTAADTAGSARLVKDLNNPELAAIASTRAAEVYGLKILVENLEDNPSNFTRFLALSKEPLEVSDPEGGDFKTSVVFSLKNQPGALFKALSVFALRDIDLTKIESRPIQGKTWEYMFYIDFAGHQESKNCARAMDHLDELATYIRVLGSYPRHRVA